jgi:hypothetical protein
MPQIVAEYAQLLQVYLDGTSSGVTMDQTIAEATNLVKFEHLLAQNVGPDPQDISEILNPATIDNATKTYVQSVDIKAMLLALADGIDGLADKFNDPDYILMFQAPKNYDNFTRNLENASK